MWYDTIIMSKSPSIASRDELRNRLRGAGLRSTLARVAVLEQLDAAAGPLSHAELADVLVPQGFDRATVYRNLIDLTEAELVSRAELGDHLWRFETRRAGGEHSAQHPHFVCVDCGEVSCLADINVDISPSPGSKRSVIGELTEVLLKGRCGRCV
jgi:Fur family transcriptional regulator, ferric uptake regulator